MTKGGWIVGCAGAVLTLVLWRLNEGSPEQSEPVRLRVEQIESGSLRITMRELPAGQYLMGSPSSEQGRDPDEGPQHTVRIEHRLALSETEVTFDDWSACVRDGGCNGYIPDAEGMGTGRHPVINVSYLDAITFTEWLSRKTGKPFRLPTEAEWEYAARAGSMTAFQNGNCLSSREANIDARYAYGHCPAEAHGSLNHTLPVSSYHPNAFGLYDMTGNVSEWAEDSWHDNYMGAPSKGGEWRRFGDDTVRMVRGGSFYSTPKHARLANRYVLPANSRNYTIGFRLALTLPGS